MIIATTTSYSRDEIKKLSEQFGTYIKIVIDINKKVCIAGMDRHYEGEQILLADGSRQCDLWGGGIDLEGNIIDCNSFINIRPNDNNTSQEIQNQDIRKKYEELTEMFFRELYVQSR